MQERIIFDDSSALHKQNLVTSNVNLDDEEPFLYNKAFMELTL